MSKISPPERGQPLDVSYISQLGTAINELDNKISTATYQNTYIDTVSSGPQTLKTLEASVIGGYVIVASNSTVTAATTKTFQYSFPTNFKFTPIVTASVINSGKTSAGENVSVVLTDVTRSNLSGLVRFNAAGNLSIIVNLIIIGVPN
jgi:hypothetical protein